MVSCYIVGPVFSIIAAVKHLFFLECCTWVIVPYGLSLAFLYVGSWLLEMLEVSLALIICVHAFLVTPAVLISVYWSLWLDLQILKLV